MNTLKEYLDFVKWAEADGLCEFLPYPDSKGIWTIGFGRNIEANPFSDYEKKLCRQMGGATEAFFTWLMEEDVKRHMDEVLRNLPWLASKPPAVRFFVTDLNYGMGWSELSKFTRTLGLLQIGKYSETAAHLPSTGWYKDVGRRAVRWCEILRGIA